MAIKRYFNLNREHNSFKKNTVSIVSYCLVASCLGFMLSAQGQEKSFEFDQSMLLGGRQHIDISKLSQNNHIENGEYLVNIFVNGHFYGKKEIQFKTNKAGETAPCFSYNELELMGVLLNKANSSIDKDSSQCLFVQETIPDASVNFESSDLKLDILIPQIYLKQEVGALLPKVS